MKITYKNYILESEDIAKTKFTLLKKVKTEIFEKFTDTKGTGKFRDETKILGYSFTLEGAIQHILKLELANKDDIITLKEYIKQYKEEVVKITNILKP